MDPQTGQYYYHAFLKEQPDLNWRNEGVQQAMLDNMRFWFERDVDGFRVDVIWHLIKDQEFRDNPIRPDYDETGMLPNRRLTATFSTDRPEVHQIIASMRSLVNRYDSRVLIGEIYLPVERLMLYYGASEDEVHLPFNFQLLFVEWSAKAVAQLVNKYEESLPPNGWPNWVLGNHDNPRIATRIGEEQARLAAMLLLTLRGTPTIYYGDELGMLDVEIPASQVRDNFGIQTPGLGRDGCRTPMPWSAELNGGFTSGIPWLPLGTNAGQINVDALANNPLSILSLYRRLLAIRKTEPALYAGTYRFVCVDQDVLVFCRESGDRRLVVALNFGDRQVNSLLPVAGQLQIVASTELRRSGEIIGDSLNLSPYEGVLAAPVP